MDGTQTTGVLMASDSRIKQNSRDERSRRSRMLKLHLTGMSVAIMLGVMISCGQHKPMADARSKFPSSEKVQNMSAPKRFPEPAIKSVEFGAWWWSEEQLAAGIYNGELPPQNTYIKLDKWQDIGDADIPHPDSIDVVCTIENRGSNAEDFVLSARGDFKVASYRWVDSHEGTHTLDELLQDVPWTEETNVGQAVVQNLGPGERREVKIKNFNLGAILEKYAAVNSGNDMWPWRFRVRIFVKKSVEDNIVQGEAILKIIPGD